MAGSSTSNKARGKELGSKLHTTGEARSSRSFVVVSGSSHSNGTHVLHSRAHNGACVQQAEILRATSEVASAAFAGGVVVHFSFGSH